MVAAWVKDMAFAGNDGWTLVLVSHLAITLLMVGLIWLVQIVHYPLFSRVGVSSFSDYHKRHTHRITIIVAPLMLLELATGLLLWFRMPLQSFWLFNTMAMALIWGSTALWQVPLHKQLALADGAARLALIRQLVASNWLRTFFWSLRGLLLVGLLLELLKQS
ncbi:MAG: hypothetical protein OES29_06340 [Desulfuromonadales bacterium]|nr:hypothetical protein [Desulfuromonadales bacterium]